MLENAKDKHNGLNLTIKTFLVFHMPFIGPLGGI